MSHPTITLTNGVRVANFSSPHSFNFTDGSELAGCDPEQSRSLMLVSVEVATPRDRWTDIALEFRMSSDVESALNELEQRDDIDIILVPLPVLSALKGAGLAIGKCRVCRVADRIGKTIHADRFCV